jgi:hypothetical protein
MNEIPLVMNPSPILENFETFSMVPIHRTGNFANVQFSRKRFNTGMEINCSAYNDMVAIQRESEVEMPKTDNNFLNSIQAACL